jgi:midasin
MGDGGQGAEVVDERLWGDDDKEAEGKEGMQEEKYEKGAAVQTKPEDDLEFRGADEADKAPDEGDKPSDEPQEDKRGNKRKEEAAEDAPGDAPINAMAPDDVEEAHGIQPEGAEGDGDDDGLPDEPLELPQDLGLDAGDDGDDAAAEEGADIDEVRADGEGEEGEDDGAGPHLLSDEAAADDMEDDGDAGADQGEAMPLNPDGGDAGAAPDVDQGAPAGSNGRGGGSALDAPQPLDQAPGLPAAAHDEGGAQATAAAGLAPGQLDATAMDEDGEHAELPDSAADALNAGGGTGGGGGTGEATGGVTGATAPADKPLGGARSAPQSSTEPNPYRNLGDALQSWRERLSVRSLRTRMFWARAARCALLGTAAQFALPDGCQLIYHSNFSDHTLTTQIYLH